jgi:1-acyl-sn-glycerol-3-phosphate acyltransferase
VRRAVVAAWRLAREAVHLLHGMAIMALRFPSLDAVGRQQRVQWWSAKLLRLAGIKFASDGVPHPGATLLVANHVSWLDIVAIHAACPQARFVSKADVLAWPLLGWLIRGAGTLFIQRERRRDAMRVVHEMANALKRGDTVAVFPEGTTGTGEQVLPFHANLLQAAIATEVPVQLAVLRYSEPGHRFSTAAHYVGDTTLLQSMWWVMGARGLRVDLCLLPAQRTRHADRRALAAHLRSAAQQVLDGEPASG